MNLPVSPSLPDSSSFSASASTQSASPAKWSASSTSGTDSSSTSFDDVFSKVGDNASPSGSSESANKGAKGRAQSGKAADDLTEAAPGTTSDSDPTTVSKQKDGHGKSLSHGDQKKAAAGDAASVANTITATTPAITDDQIAAALAASITGSASLPAVDPKVSRTSGDSDATNILTLKNSKGRSITELLGQGASVLNFEAGPTTSAAGKPADSKTTVNEGAPAVSSQNASASPSTSSAATDKTSVTQADVSAVTPIDSKAVTQKAETDVKKQATADASELTAAASSEKPEQSSKPTLSRGKSDLSAGLRPVDSTPFSKPLTGAQGSAEKFADDGGRRESSGDDSSNHSAKNTALIAEFKQLKNSGLKVGTDTAIGSAPMMSNLHAPANNAASSGVLATASSSAVATTSEVHATASSQAAALVHQINEIGEGLWRVDRQSVEVNFNFGDKDHLSVRVEYKNGQVQATFNTSSTELRTAITQAWNSQNSSDNRSYKMADPVFTSSSNASFSSSDDSSSHSRQFASFQDASTFAGAASRSRSSSQTVSAASASTSSRASLRPEVAGHLNAIV